jgi:hypothetical protein
LQNLNGNKVELSWAAFPSSVPRAVFWTFEGSRKEKFKGANLVAA